MEPPDLNDRQWTYLTALYRRDQAAEDAARHAWPRYRSRPASEWRWIEYDLGPLAEETVLRAELRRAGIVDPGTGSTWKALETRGLVKVREGRGSLGQKTIHVQLTRAGRKAVRERLGEAREKPLPAGALREWHWRALEAAYHAGEEGIPSDGAAGYARWGWSTWRRLRDYHWPRVGPRPLVEEVDVGQWQYRLRITAAGRHLYETQREAYAARYPDST